MSICEPAYNEEPVDKEELILKVMVREQKNLSTTKYLDCDIMLFWWLEKNKDLTTKQQVEELYSYICNLISGPITYEGLKRRKLQLDTKGLIPYNV